MQVFSDDSAAADGSPSSDSGPARVYLVGAGPGHPDLITLRAVQCLAKSDVVLYDGLSNRSILDHASQAECICVGKHGQSRIWKQPEIIEEMLRHVRAGKVVARLKGGDPAVFARTAEEVDALVEAKIPFEIVPGITAALAAGPYAGIPVTHRGIASAVALVTGHEEPSKSESALDWPALARFPGTLVVYMGVTTAGSWTEALIEGGKDPSTPVALIRRCSLPDQQTLHCRLDEVAERLTPASKFRPPVISIVGPVTRLAETMDWLSRRPLHGQTALVTRPADKADGLSVPLQELGANVIEQPLIETVPLKDFGPLDRAIGNMSKSDWLVFCSPTAVKHWADRLMDLGLDSRAASGCRIACVGSSTQVELWEHARLNTDLVPKEHTSDQLAEELAEESPVRVTIFRANRGRDVIKPALESIGTEVEEVAAYQHQNIELIDESVMAAVESGRIDWIPVTSSATADQLHHFFGEKLEKIKLAALSPITAEALSRHGYEAAVVADVHTMEGLVDAMRNFDASSDHSRLR